MFKAVVTVLLALSWSGVADADPKRAVAFNIERGFKSSAKMEGVVAIIRNDIGYAGLWAFSEVSKGDEPALAEALGHGFEVVLGSKGTDHLAVGYDAFSFELVETVEIPLTNDGRYRRNPLALRLIDKRDGDEFWFVSVHLLRGQGDDPDDRRVEASDLNRWVQAQSLPVIAMGDFNIDFNLGESSDDADRAVYLVDQNRFAGGVSKAADAIVDGDALFWVVPERLIRTYCPGFHSILDFAFVSDFPGRDQAASTIVPTFCSDRDDVYWPDHRPVDLVFDIR
jgi:hypothetical protein